MFEIRLDEKVTTMDDSVIHPHEAYELHDWPKQWIKRFPAGFPKIEGEKITVAVMDSGIDKEVAEDHPWFANTEVTKFYDATTSGQPEEDSVGHGTGVASIIARTTPEIEMYSVKIFSKQANTGMKTISDAYTWLLRHSDEIDVVNMSWGAPGTDIPEIDQLHDKLIDMGVYDVVSAGNTGSDGGSPATAKNAFSVGALTEDGEPTRFSSWDPDQGNPEVAAVGKDVKMARAKGTDMGKPLNQDYVKASGTSFSAPYTASAYVNALYKERSNWDNKFVRNAQDIPGTKRDGAGILKLNEALKESKETDPNSNKTKTESSAWNFRGNDTMWIDADWLPTGDTTVELINETKNYIDIRIEK